MYYTYFTVLFIICFNVQSIICRDEDKIMKACYWPNELYEPCFGGCAEVTCDNPRNHLRPCYPYCEPGCICEDPYVRDDRTHQCVLPQECSPTQMGIPVPSKRTSMEKMPLQAQVTNKYNGGRQMRVNHNKRDDGPPDFSDSDNVLLQSSNSILPQNSNTQSNNNNNKNNLNTNSVSALNMNSNLKDDFKRGTEVSRMGNYFNIVIAPPPIKALQPRKLLQNDGYRSSSKRMN